MPKHYDVSGCEKGQIVMAGGLDRSISKTAALVGFPGSGHTEGDPRTKTGELGDTVMDGQDSLRHTGCEDELKPEQEYHPNGQAWRGHIMLMGCFSASGTGNLVKTDGVMKKEDSLKILDESPVGSVHEFTLSEDNDDLKHAAQVARNNSVNVLESEHDLNTSENLWRELKIRFRVRKLFIQQQLEAKEE